MVGVEDNDLKEMKLLSRKMRGGGGWSNGGRGEGGDFCTYYLMDSFLGSKDYALS